MFALAMQSPALSSFLLVVAGILVGYALSYPYRGESEEILEELNSLRNENQNLQHTIRDQQTSIVELNSVVQAEVTDQDLTQELTQAMQENRALQSQMSAIQQKLSLATRTETELRGEVEELKLVRQHQSNHNQDGVRRLELTIESLTKRLYEVEEEKRTAAALLENERLQRRDLDDTIREKEQQLQQQDGDLLEDLRAQLRTTQTSLEHTTANLKRVIAERDDITEQFQVQRKEIIAIAQDRDDHLRAIETIERLRNTSDGTVAEYEDRVQELESRLAQNEVLLDQAHADIAHHHQQQIKFDQERDSLAAELDHFRERSSELESGVRRLQHDTDRIRSQREEVLASLRIEQDRTNQLSSDLEQHRSMLQEREIRLQPNRRATAIAGARHGRDGIIA